MLQALIAICGLLLHRLVCLVRSRPYPEGRAAPHALARWHRLATIAMAASLALIFTGMWVMPAGMNRKSPVWLITDFSRHGP